jgi:hypothetical protein
MRVRERVRGQEPGHAAAAGGVGLEHVDGAGLEHAAKVEGLVAVLAGRDVHACRAAIPFLEPAHPGVGERGDEARVQRRDGERVLTLSSPASASRARSMVARSA